MAKEREGAKNRGGWYKGRESERSGRRSFARRRESRKAVRRPIENDRSGSGKPVVRRHYRRRMTLTHEYPAEWRRVASHSHFGCATIWRIRLFSLISRYRSIPFSALPYYYMRISREGAFLPRFMREYSSFYCPVT